MDRRLRQSQASEYLGSVITDEGSKPQDTLQGSTDDSSTDKAETSLERQKHFSQLQNTTEVLPCHINLPVWNACESLTSQHSCPEEYKPRK